jgi:hypothetical protein
VQKKQQGERKKEKEMLAGKKQGSKLIFGDFWTRFSSCSGHEMHLYL